MHLSRKTHCDFPRLACEPSEGRMSVHVLAVSHHVESTLAHSRCSEKT